MLTPLIMWKWKLSVDTDFKGEVFSYADGQLPVEEFSLQSHFQGINVFNRALNMFAVMYLGQVWIAFAYNK